MKYQIFIDNRATGPRFNTWTEAADEAVKLGIGYYTSTSFVFYDELGGEIRDTPDNESAINYSESETSTLTTLLLMIPVIIILGVFIGLIIVLRQ